MDETLSWPLGGDDDAEEPTAAPATSASARFGGDEEPVLIARISGPIAIEMARDALQSAGVPAFVKQNSLGPLYGLSIGSFGSAEVWTPPAFAERARDTLIGIGLLVEPAEPTDPDA